MRNRRLTKRLFAVLMVFVMVVGFLPTATLAGDGSNTSPAVVSGQETQTGVATPASADGSLPAVAYTVYAGDWFTDADNDPLTYSVVSAAYGTDDVSADVSISGGAITYTPAAAQAGGAVTIVVRANDGAADSTGNVTINVAVNPVPADTEDSQPPTDPSGQKTQTTGVEDLFRTKELAAGPVITANIGSSASSGPNAVYFKFNISLSTFSDISEYVSNDFTVQADMNDPDFSAFDLVLVSYDETNYAFMGWSVDGGAPLTDAEGISAMGLGGEASSMYDADTYIRPSPSYVSILVKNLGFTWPAELTSYISGIAMGFYGSPLASAHTVTPVFEQKVTEPT